MNWDRMNSRIQNSAVWHTSQQSSAQTATATPLSGGDELARCKAFQVPTAGGPLKFWSDHASEYPVMSQVARCVLCISVSSAE